MKKTPILFLFAALPLFIAAQTIEVDPETKLYATSAVVPIDSTTKDVLYAKALEWVSLNYKSAKDVIQLSDKESGKIICKGNFKTSLFMKEGWIEHTMILEFKDNRYRYTFTNFAYYSKGSGTVNFEDSMISKKKVIGTTEEKVKESVEGLTAHLKKAKANDKW